MIYLMGSTTELLTHNHLKVGTVGDRSWTAVAAFMLNRESYSYGNYW